MRYWLAGLLAWAISAGGGVSHGVSAQGKPAAPAPIEHTYRNINGAALKAYIFAPTVIVHGERDSLTPLSGARRFCERIREGGGRCELNVYPGVGHLLTRNLANQESDFDPDPAARDDGNAKQIEFIRSLWPK